MKAREITLFLSAITAGQLSINFSLAFSYYPPVGKKTFSNPPVNLLESPCSHCILYI
jgi:hypothetical protein